LILNNLKIGLHLLSDNKSEDALQVIKDNGKKIEKMNDLDPLIYSYFYKLSARYYASKRILKNFIKMDFNIWHTHMNLE